MYAVQNDTQMKFNSVINISMW